MGNLNATRLVAMLAACVAGLVMFDVGVAAENARKLSGAETRAMFSGKQVTDEVHWREIYERDGRLRSYAMGKKQVGKWFVHADELCIDLPEPDGGRFEVT